MRDTQREAETQREKQAPCEEPNVGLNPRTPGSQPELKADAQPLSHPCALLFFYFKDFTYLFMRDTHIERDRDTGRGRSRPYAGSPTWD